MGGSTKATELRNSVLTIEMYGKLKYFANPFKS